MANRSRGATLVPDDVTDAVLGALAHGGRRRMLAVLQEHGGSMSSGEIAQQFSTAWSTTTRHLTVLLDAGLVVVEKRGRERMYRARPEVAERVLELARPAPRPEGAMMTSEATTKTRPLELTSVMLYVSSVSRAVSFYSTCGFELERDDEGFARMRAPGGGELLLHPVPDGGSVAAPGVNLYFEVPDVDGHYDRLCDAGIEFDFPPTDMAWGRRHAYLRDPDGHALSFVQRS
jgi:DNA-binding transcriptional ArsR family regulator/catechol 2,3-dioxygenase-like lactoylglutathione lyase family enzyme